MLQVQALEKSGNDTDIHCSESEFGHPHEDFAVMLDKMERSVSRSCLSLAMSAGSRSPCDSLGNNKNFAPLTFNQIEPPYSFGSDQP